MYKVFMGDTDWANQVAWFFVIFNSVMSKITNIGVERELTEEWNEKGKERCEREERENDWYKSFFS